MKLLSKLLLVLTLLLSTSCWEGDEANDATSDRNNINETSKSWESSQLKIPTSVYQGLSVDEVVATIADQLDDWQSLDQSEKQYLFNKIYVYLSKQEDYPISKIIKISEGGNETGSEIINPDP